MKITIYSNFSKKKNSTKRPTGGTEIDVFLKESTSILKPIFLCESIPDTVNYIYVPDFGRYYFVDDILKVSATMKQFGCQVDPLATAKTAITASNFYIERSNSLYDAAVSDAQVFPTNDIVQAVSTEGNLLSNLNLSGAGFVARIVGKNGAKNYLINEAILQSAFNSFFDINTIDFSDIEHAINSLFVCMADPSSYIKSIMWFPFAVNYTNTETPFFGFVDGGVNSVVVTSIQDGTTSITVPPRYYNDYRDFDSRFTTCSVFLPGVGDIALDAKHLENNDLGVWYYTDVDTGSGVAVLSDGSAIIGTYSYQAGCNIAMGGITGNNLIAPFAKTIGSVLPTPSNIGKLLTGGAIGSVGSNVLNTIEAQLHPAESFTSATGNRRYWITNPEVRVSVIRLGSTGAPGATKGRPAKQTATLSSLSGYVVCSDASIDCGLTGIEKDMINAYLNSGFYLE